MQIYYYDATTFMFCYKNLVGNAAGKYAGQPLKAGCASDTP